MMKKTNYVCACVFVLSVMHATSMEQPQTTTNSVITASPATAPVAASLAPTPSTAESKTRAQLIHEKRKRHRKNPSHPFDNPIDEALANQICEDLASEFENQ